jgi:hypothetical protein
VEDYKVVRCFLYVFMNGEDAGIMEETAVTGICPEEVNTLVKCLKINPAPVQELNPEPAECEAVPLQQTQLVVNKRLTTGDLINGVSAGLCSVYGPPPVGTRERKLRFINQDQPVCPALCPAFPGNLQHCGRHVEPPENSHVPTRNALTLPCAGVSSDAAWYTITAAALRRYIPPEGS